MTAFRDEAMGPGPGAADGHPQAWPSIGAQVERLAADIVAQRRLAAAGDPLTTGAALAAAHGALRLAATPAVAETDRSLRRAELTGAVGALAIAGLPHVGELVRAALLHDGDPAVVARGVERPQ